MTTVEYAQSVSMDDRIESPLWWHRGGLQQTATGYGSKLTTPYKIPYNGRLYRIYAICYSNVASHYITVMGQKLFLH